MEQITVECPATLIRHISVTFGRWLSCRSNGDAPGESPFSPFLDARRAAAPSAHLLTPPIAPVKKAIFPALIQFDLTHLNVRYFTCFYLVKFTTYLLLILKSVNCQNSSCCFTKKNVFISVEEKKSIKKGPFFDSIVARNS